MNVKIQQVIRFLCVVIVLGTFGLVLRQADTAHAYDYPAEYYTNYAQYLENYYNGYYDNNSYSSSSYSSSSSSSYSYNDNDDDDYGSSYNNGYSSSSYSGYSSSSYDYDDDDDDYYDRDNDDDGYYDNDNDDDDYYDRDNDDDGYYDNDNDDDDYGRGQGSSSPSSSREYYGTISSRPAGASGTWVIGGAYFTVNSSTRFEYGSHSRFYRGSYVEVEYSIINGHNVASKIELER